MLLLLVLGRRGGGGGGGLGGLAGLGGLECGGGKGGRPVGCLFFLRRGWRWVGGGGERGGCEERGCRRVVCLLWVRAPGSSGGRWCGELKPRCGGGNGDGGSVHVRIGAVAVVGIVVATAVADVGTGDYGPRSASEVSRGRLVAHNGRDCCCWSGGRGLGGLVKSAHVAAALTRNLSSGGGPRISWQSEDEGRRARYLGAEPDAAHHGSPWRSEVPHPRQCRRIAARRGADGLP